MLGSLYLLGVTLAAIAIYGCHWWSGDVSCELGIAAFHDRDALREMRFMCAG